MSTERAYGEKYVKGLGTKEIAAKIREEIKAAVKAGELPKAKYSVRKTSGKGIDVEISCVVAPGFKLFNPEWLERSIREPHAYFGPGLKRYSEEAAAIAYKLERMLWAYNYDGSDTMTDYFDVNFYGRVAWCWKWEAEVKKVEGAGYVKEAV